VRASLGEIAEGFDLSQFGAAPTKFDVDDLFPLTRTYVQALPFDAMQAEISALGVPETLAPRFWDVARENITVRADLAGWWTLCRDGATPDIAPEDAEFVAQALTLLPDPP